MQTELLKHFIAYILNFPTLFCLLNLLQIAIFPLFETVKETSHGVLEFLQRGAAVLIVIIVAARATAPAVHHVAGDGGGVGVLSQARGQHRGVLLVPSEVLVRGDALLGGIFIPGLGALRCGLVESRLVGAGGRCAVAVRGRTGGLAAGAGGGGRAVDRLFGGAFRLSHHRSHTARRSVEAGCRSFLYLK